MGALGPPPIAHRWTQRRPRPPRQCYAAPV